MLTVAEEQIDPVPRADLSLIQAIARIDERLVAMLTLDSLAESTTELNVAA